MAAGTRSSEEIKHGIVDRPSRDDRIADSIVTAFESSIPEEAEFHRGPH